MGALRSPFPGLPSLCSETPGPSLAIFCLFNTLSSGKKKGPFSKTELENLSSRQSPSSILKSHLKPSPRHHCIASVPGRVGHSHSAPLCWGQFWCLEASPIRWVESISPHSHVPIRALSPGHSLPLPPPTPGQHCSISFWVELSPLAPHLLVSSQGTTIPSTPSLASLLIALSSSQLCRMSGTGSALADQAMMTAACPPSMHCCRLRSSPSRYWDDLCLPGDAPHQGGASPPPPSSPARSKQQLEGSWDITEGKLSPVSHSQFSSKGRTQTQVWHLCGTF